MTAWRADLLSDTVTRPSAGMRRAMAEAEVGDDVFGEDPTVLVLQERVAALLGHEAGLFTPTGSLANQLALRLQVSPGEELIADRLAHVVRAELGAAAVFSGITSRTWNAPDGVLRAADPLEMVVTGAGPYQVSTALIVVENTHNFGGGSVQPIEQIRQVREHTQAVGVRMHLDGARLWNAHIASGVALADYGALFDTVSVCLSKGLGAPIGSVLVGSSELIDAARIWRKRYGAGMRQVGILAAAGLYALDHQVQRLVQDHDRARRAAQALAEAAPGCIDPDRVQTNILMLSTAGTGWSPTELTSAAAAAGVRGYAAGPSHVRLVWHLDVDDAGTAAAIDVLAGLLRQRPGRGGAPGSMPPG